MGLGSVNAVPLARAREMAIEVRRRLAEGQGPMTECQTDKEE